MKGTRTPRDYQREVIRSALVLKLHQYEDTGALAGREDDEPARAPRAAGATGTTATAGCATRTSRRTPSNASATTTRWSGSSSSCATCARSAPGELAARLIRSTGGREAPEQELPWLAGYLGEQPVRVGNQAFEHVQNDVYGEMILAVSRLFLDARFAGDLQPRTALALISRLLDQIERRLEEPDAGPWELRGANRLHSFTVLAHWAGAMRAEEVAEALGDDEVGSRAESIKQAAAQILMEKCWNDELGVLTQVAGGKELDAVLLLAVQLGFFPPDDPRADSHVNAIQQALRVNGGLLQRYAAPDDFGKPVAAFTVCSFWLAEALALLGRHDEGRELFEHLLSLHNELGLYSEDILPGTLTMTGNFPQTYSHVGLINAAFRLSRRWE